MLAELSFIYFLSNLIEVHGTLRSIETKIMVSMKLQCELLV